MPLAASPTSCWAAPKPERDASELIDPLKRLRLAQRDCCRRWYGCKARCTLGSLGFTMSIFIANLAFVDPGSLGAAKLGVLSASVIAAVLG